VISLKITKVNFRAKKKQVKNNLLAFLDDLKN